MYIYIYIYVCMYVYVSSISSHNIKPLYTYIKETEVKGEDKGEKDSKPRATGGTGIGGSMKEEGTGVRMLVHIDKIAVYHAKEKALALLLEKEKGDKGSSKEGKGGDKAEAGNDCEMVVYKPNEIAPELQFIPGIAEVKSLKVARDGNEHEKILNETESNIKFGLFMVTLMYFRCIYYLRREIRYVMNS
jgi:hypothetical protein